MTVTEYIITGVIFLLLIILGASFIHGNNKESRCRVYLSEQGFDIKDVKVFLDSFDYSASDFLNSQGLRKQYESWKRGDNMMEARVAVQAKKAAEQARSSANVAVGVSAASMMMNAARSK